MGRLIKKVKGIASVLLDYLLRFILYEMDLLIVIERRVDATDQNGDN